MNDYDNEGMEGCAPEGGVPTTDCGRSYYAVIKAEEIVRSPHPPSALEEVIVQSRPHYWMLNHWHTHVWGKFLDAYQDWRHIDGYPVEKAIVLAYHSAIEYTLNQPDLPEEFKQGWGVRYRQTRRNTTC